MLGLPQWTGEIESQFELRALVPQRVSLPFTAANSVMNPDQKCRCRLTVEGESDPTLPARILALLTVRGELPDWFSVQKISDDALTILIDLIDPGEHALNILVEKVRNIPSVNDVLRI